MGGYPLRPPTHRRNGGPLPRRLPNGTHAHPHPPKLSIQDHAAPDDHGGLIRLSAGYTPDAGRLHTRYAPVRRSPPGYCYPALPLDLHVLGLPLAFILSQDQTLRCLKACRLSPQKGPQRVCLCFIVLSGVISTAPRALAPKQHPCTLLCMLLLSCCPSRQRTRGFRRLSLLPAGSRALSSLKNSPSSFPLSLNRLVRSRKRVQRYSCSPPPPNFLTTFFQKKLQLTDNQGENFSQKVHKLARDGGIFR